MRIKNKKEVRLHLTNIAGLGAIRLIESLLPSLLSSPEYSIEEIYLPCQCEFLPYFDSYDKKKLIPYKRWLPNSISRFLECTIFSWQFNGETPLIVMGDIPLRSKTKQIVFMQNFLLTKDAVNGQRFGAIKYGIARWLFKRNLKFATSFIVQTEAIKKALLATYPEMKAPVHVIAQPAPSWILNSGLRHFNSSRRNSALRFFYPAMSYPHKNHQILENIDLHTSNEWLINELVLTIASKENPNPEITWIKCVNKLSPEQVIQAYKNTDALLFLSLSESLGLPLIEAMYIGMPIICPHLPYAQELCGNEAIYFDPQRIDSLKDAIKRLNKKLEDGWSPNWAPYLQKIPNSWQEVAHKMLNVATEDYSK